MKKILLYAKMSIMYMFRNRTRMILTIMGIAIGLFIYVFANVTTNSYINELYAKANSFSDNSYLIEDLDGSFINNLVKEEKLNISKFNFSAEGYRVYREYSYEELDITNSINLIGINRISESQAIPYMYDNDVSLSNLKLLYGTLFSQEALNSGENKIIIERSTAKLLFQKENVVGEEIDIFSPYGYKRLMICGVIEDMPYTKYNNLTFNKILNDNSQESFDNYFIAYTPYNYLANLMSDNTYLVRYVAETDSIEAKERFESLIDNIETYSLAARIESKSTLIDDAHYTESTIKVFFNVILIIIFMISGFVVMTIYCFSVKERTYEIGVRRALGASRFEIVMQFIIEGIITALISAIITIFISIILCNYATGIFFRLYYNEISIKLSYRLIGATFGIAVLEGILFSLLPAIMASRIMPTEALRWD